MKKLTLICLALLLIFPAVKKQNQPNRLSVYFNLHPDKLSMTLLLVFRMV